MITLRLTTDKELILSTLCEPIIWKKTRCDGEDMKSFQIPPTSLYFKILNDGEYTGLLEVLEQNSITLTIHYYVLPQYWGKKIGVNSLQCLIKFLQHNLPYKKLITWTADEQKQVIQAALEGGFQIEGHLTNACMFNNTIQGVTILGMEI